MNRVLHWLHRAAQLRFRVLRPVTVGVRLILVRERRVLLVHHTYLPDWFLPGGGVKRGETLEEAARREAAEEVGATLGPLRLFGVYTNFREHKSDHVAVWVCEEFELGGRTDREIETFRFFALDALPPDLSPGTRRRLAEYAAGGAPRAAPW